MPVDKSVEKLIDKVNSGELKKYLNEIDGTDFGLFIRVYVHENTVKPMLNGYSQHENNLVISITDNKDDIPSDAKTVAWFGGKDTKDQKCVHPKTGPNNCTHCTEHTNPGRKCTGHGKTGNPLNDFKAPKLDYDSVIKNLDNKNDLLKNLAKEDFGLTLLHGHSDEHMFTKLPEGYVSVISNNETSFRKEEEVINDEAFVPNMWRSIDGQIKVAGGYLL